MSLVYLTKGIEFSAAHRYLREEWDNEKNRDIFGACFNEPGHGHNYFLEVTLAGQVDDHTGMVVNLYDLKVVLKQVLEEFDHKHLNLDTPYFKDAVPTTENIARVIWRQLERHRTIGRLDTLKLAEDEDLFAMLRASKGLDQASVTRRYGARVESVASAAVRDARGYDYDLFVTVSGSIDPVTGMVIDLRELDRLVCEKVLSSLSREYLGLRRPERGGTGEELVRAAWDLLVPHVSGVKLEQVKLVESRDLAYEYMG